MSSQEKIEPKSGIEAIEELMVGISAGQWDWTNHVREDGKPIESVEDVAAILASSARKGTRLELNGVGAKEGGEDIVVCYTGNGPKSAANARFLANAPDAIRWLLDELNRRAPSEREKAREVEVVAAECHKQWSGWTKYLLGKMEPWGHDKEYLLMSKVWADRWRKQIVTPHEQLSEAEKESDRVEARKILAALGDA